MSRQTRSMPRRRHVSGCVAARVAACILITPVSASSSLDAGVNPFQSVAHALYQANGVHRDTIVIRFLPDSDARVREGRLVSLTGADLTVVESIVARFSGSLEPRFPQRELALDELRARAEARSGQSLPDLNLFATLHLPHEENEEAALARLKEILAQLRGSGPVAEAWPDPIVIPASQVDPRSAASGSNGTTPDFSTLQGYLYNAPTGIEAATAWAFPGGRGQGVDVIDHERGWLWSHEDLKDPFFETGGNNLEHHGTAVIGVLVGQHNGLGINGIVPDVRIGSVSLDDFSVPGGIAEAIAHLDPGDILLMEYHCGGPSGFLPCEWLSDIFAAIQVATAAGIIVVEPGGNGENHLDDPLYGKAFDRRVRDSGAIMVGAGTPTGLSGEWFTNYGTRLDLHGWGRSVVTTGYGDLYGTSEEQFYSADFKGTSSASPIVAGAIASLQGQAVALFGAPLTAGLAEEILGMTGSPWSGNHQIGERPDLAAARSRLLLGYGDLSIEVRDGLTLDPLPEIHIQVLETGRLAHTTGDGTMAMQLSATPLTLRAEGGFYHYTRDVPYAMSAGGEESVSIDLDPIPLGNLAGRVRNLEGIPVSGALVSLLDTPVAQVVSDPSGHFEIPGVPVRQGYQVLVFGAPTYGCAYVLVDVETGGQTSWNPFLPNAYSFELVDGAFVPTNEWEWGERSRCFFRRARLGHRSRSSLRQRRDLDLDVCSVRSEKRDPGDSLVPPLVRHRAE